MKINQEREKLQQEGFEALKQNDFNGWCIMPTGSGKSNVIIRCIKELKPKSILYLCDGTRLRDVDFPAELKKWGAEEYLEIMDRCCYQTAYKFVRKEYDLVIGDEGDFGLTEKYSRVFFKNKFKWMVLVSATLSDDKRILAERIAPIVFEKTISDVSGSGVVNKEQVHFIHYMLSAEENVKYLAFNDAFKRLLNEKHPNKYKLEMLQINRKHFLSSLNSSKNSCIKLLKELYKKDVENKILVFCGLSEQADKISKYTFHSGNKKEGWFDKFNEGEIRLLAVVGMVDRGLNLKNGVNNIIFEAPSRSKTKLTQKSGRGRRLDPKDTVHLYFCIPFYKTRFGDVKPTIVQSWVMESCKDINLKTAKIYELGN